MSPLRTGLLAAALVVASPAWAVELLQVPSIPGASQVIDHLEWHPIEGFSLELERSSVVGGGTRTLGPVEVGGARFRTALYAGTNELMFSLYPGQSLGDLTYHRLTESGQQGVGPTLDAEIELTDVVVTSTRLSSEGARPAVEMGLSFRTITYTTYAGGTQTFCYDVSLRQVCP